MKPPRLYARWSKRERALVYGTDPMLQGMADAGRLAYVMEPIAKELALRGYDLTTLRFQVRLKGQR